MKVLRSHDFEEVLTLINSARKSTFAVISRNLVQLYWSVGEYVFNRVEKESWGKSTVEELSAYIIKKQPEIKGFSAPNMWRMKQFYETYRGNEKLSPLVRELGWTQNCIIMAQCKTQTEREFYLKSSIKGNWGKRELETQIKSGLFER